MHKASENLQTAIEKGRTDIVRTIIEACQKCKSQGNPRKILFGPDPNIIIMIIRV